MSRLARLEYLLLLTIASSLTALWLGLWVKWLLGASYAGLVLPRFWPAGLAVAGLASALLTNRVLDRRRVAPPAARAALAGAGGLAVMLLVGWALGARASFEALQTGARFAGLVGPAAPAFLAGLYAWWQGERIGRSPLGNQGLRSAFYTGLLALAPLLALNSLFAAVSGAQVLGALVLFFALGLSGLALTSLRHLRWQQTSRRAALSMSRQWLLTSGAVIAVVLGGGLLAARAVVPQALARLAASLGALAGGLALALGLLLSPLAVLIDRLLAPALPGLARFFEQFIGALGVAFARLQSLFASLAQLASFAFPRFLNTRWLQELLASPDTQVYLRWAGLVALLALAGGIFWLAARRLWGLQSTDEDEQRESVLSRRLLLAQLKNLLNRRPRRRSGASPAYLSLSGAPDDARLIIRRAYQAMLEWARSLALPRAAGQTPRAYAQMLAGAVPDGHDSIELLTQAYTVARYAAEAPSLEQARRAEGALARLKALHS